VLTAPDNFACVFDYVHSIGYNVHHYIHFNQEVNMASKSRPNGYWKNKDLLIMEASKYASKSEFQKNNGSAYIAMRKFFPSLIDELFVNKHKSWTKEKLIEEAKKYTSKVDFETNNASAYNLLRIRYKDLLDELFVSQRNSWSEEKLRIEISKWSTKADFKAGNPRAYYAVYRICPNLLNEFLESKLQYWNEENLREESKKWGGKHDLFKGNTGAYLAMTRRHPGLIDELYNNKINYHTKESLVNTMKLCASKQSFRFFYPSEYHAATNRFPGLIDYYLKNSQRYTKQNCIYLWHMEADIYKIGTTSLHLGRNRIKLVAKAANFDEESISIIRLSPVNNALLLEKKLLKIGGKVSFDNKFDGSTEFRKLNNNELNFVLDIIDKETDYSLEVAV
jgi:hypothetical protein